MKEKNRGKTLWDLRRTMKIRRVICNSGPASQFTYVNQFIALRHVTLESIPIPRPLCKLYFAARCRFYEFSFLYLLNGAAFGAAQGHRVATIRNYHSLFCSTGRIARPRDARWDCAVQPSQCHNG